MPRLGSCHLWQLARHGHLATFGQQLRKPWVILSDARCRGSRSNRPWTIGKWTVSGLFANKIKTIDGNPHPPSDPLFHFFVGLVSQSPVLVLPVAKEPLGTVPGPQLWRAAAVPLAAAPKLRGLGARQRQRLPGAAAGGPEDVWRTGGTAAERPVGLMFFCWGNSPNLWMLEMIRIQELLSNQNLNLSTAYGCDSLIHADHHKRGRSTRFGDHFLGENHEKPSGQKWWFGAALPPLTVSTDSVGGGADGQGCSNSM